MNDTKFIHAGFDRKPPNYHNLRYKTMILSLHKNLQSIPNFYSILVNQLVYSVYYLIYVNVVISLYVL